MGDPSSEVPKLSKTEVLLGMTIEDKVNKACTHFDRMHALYHGESANVALLALGGFGLGDDLISTQQVNQEPKEDEPIACLATPTKILPENAGGDNPMEDIEAPFWDQYPTVTDLANEVYKGDVTEATENSPDPPSPSCAPNSSPNPAVRTQAARSSAAAAARTSPPPPLSTPVAAGRPNASATPAPAKRGRPNGPGAPPRNRNSPPAVSSTKQTMAFVYSDKLSQKTEYLRYMADNKHKWKEADLIERREARLEASLEIARREQKAHLHALKVDKENSLKAEFHAKAEREHALQILRVDRKTQLLLELFRSNKSEDQVKGMIKLIDHLDEPAAIPDSVDAN